MGVLVRRSSDLGSSDAQRAGTQSGYRAITRAAASMGFTPEYIGATGGKFYNSFTRSKPLAAATRLTLRMTVGQGSFGPSGEGLGRSGTAGPFGYGGKQNRKIMLLS
jgi:hypothetical protein